MIEDEFGGIQERPEDVLDRGAAGGAFAGEGCAGGLPFLVTGISRRDRFGIGFARIDGHAARDHVLLDEAVLSANISENTLRSSFTVINKAKGKTVVRGNLSEV